MIEPLLFDARHHRPGTVAQSGRCSWHGLSTCGETPTVSFQDGQGHWQSGCQRAVEELTSRGEMTPP